MTTAKATLVSPNERIDKEDFDNLTAFAKGNLGLRTKLSWLDLQSRILKNFRVELPDQSTYPGRIVVHAGAGFDIDGELLFNQSQLDISRTITLEGAGTTFYVEIKFIESDASLDSRGFWDPSVDQGSDPSGDPRPDGQEFSAGVATRRIMDWKIVQPVRTDKFSRDNDPTSPYLPLIKVVTDNANKITVTVNPSLATENAATAILEVISTTRIRVKDSTYLPDNAGTMTVGYGTGSSESVTVSLNDRTTNILTISTLSNTHYPGEIVRAAAGSTDFITESQYGRYAKSQETSPVDYRDKMFQGDEEHGHILSRAMTGSTEQRSDVSIQALKDYVDFLSSQIEELKWGNTSPYTSGTSVQRTPPGLVTGIATNPRYYHKSAGVNGARTASVTVGDGTKSWGDFVGATSAAIIAAVNALPAAGGTIYIRAGDYSLTSAVSISKNIHLICDQDAYLSCDGGYLNITTTGRVHLSGLNMKPGTVAPTYLGLFLGTTPWDFKMDNCYLLNVQFQLEVSLPTTASISHCLFHGTDLTNFLFPLISVSDPSAALSGTWSDCDFMNLSQNFGVGACIDMSSSDTGIVLAEFNNCSFSGALLNWELIHMGDAPSTVHFSQCSFSSFLTLGYITLTNGSNIWFDNCYGNDNFATFLNASDSSKIYIDGYLSTHASSTGFSQIFVTNCNDVRIKNCKLRGNSGTSLSGTPIFITCTSGVMQTIILEGNTIEFDSDLGTGVIFSLNGGTEIRDVMINHNQFKLCEAGIYFSNPGTAATYSDIIIDGNSFFDASGLLGVSAYQKVGIYGGSTSSKKRWTISNNTFCNFNPINTNAVGTASRNAVYLGSTGNYEFVISGNRCLNVGDPFFPMANTAAFRFNHLYNSTISENTMVGIYGTYAYGVEIDNTLSDCSISNNVFLGIYGSQNALSAFGVFSGANILRTSITGNTFKTIEATAGGLSSNAAGVGTNSTSVGTWTAVEIANNSFLGTSANGVDTIAIYPFAKIIAQVTITGNTSGGQNRNFFELISTTGGYFEEVTITGNTILDASLFSIYLQPGGASCRCIVISGNAFKGSVGPFINALGIQFGITIANNNMWLDGAGAIYCGDVIFAKIIGNHIRTDDTGDEPIIMGSGCDYYNITCNTISGTSSRNSIKTTGASTTKGFVTNNFIDSNTNLHANDSVGWGNLAF